MIRSDELRNADSDWPIDAVVAELRQIREASLAARHRERVQAKLPSRRALGQLIERLGEALFPNRLVQRGLGREGADYFVGSTLDSVLRELREQVLRELEFQSATEAASDQQSVQTEANAIVRDFAAQLPAIRQLLDTDIQAAFEGDPAARSVDEVLVCYPGVTAVIHHRLAHALHRLGARLVARIIAEIAHSLTGIDIHPGATIGNHFFIDHGTGVVVGETAIIGNRVRLYQAVTLGAKRFPTDAEGRLVKGNARHPIVEDDVVIYAGATILGRITIGRNSVIGGSVWLTRSVPPHSQISQASVRTEEFESGSGI